VHALEVLFMHMHCISLEMVSADRTSPPTNDHYAIVFVLLTGKKRKD